ncbi:hypothetical protein FN846DRAFT_914744 [Sphaerosporella brunnea]|uniref:Uncharacterized protein n=1 Tax=Sphaerosporella brunnea TaxID=1250544 RepID=A0A5J5ECA9_9PEZI|nr:hypothetical protein FN846DRAFT_914744 [Sphaerosporella brunnea]
MCLIRVKPELDEELPPRVVTTERRPSARGPRSMASSRGSIIETVRIPPPPASSSGVVRETQIVQVPRPPATAVVRHSDYYGDNRHEYYEHSPRASVISTHSRSRSRGRDYYVDGSSVMGGRSPRGSFRHVDGRHSAHRIEGLDVEERSRGRHEYNNFHGRRSGSVNYVNPRHSHRSVRSHGGGRVSREKVVVVEKEGGYY